MGTLTFWGIREPVPGPRWRQLLDATWSGYRGWYVGHGAGARPTLATAADMLDRHMPELVPTWRRLVDLAAGDETAARFLTLYDPPRFLPGCAQVALVDDALALIRNYDYRPDLCERRRLLQRLHRPPGDRLRRLPVGPARRHERRRARRLAHLR